MTGKLADPENVLVDVGARYYVEKVGKVYIEQIDIAITASVILEAKQQPLMHTVYA